MATYPNLTDKPELLKMKTRDDEIKNLKYQTEQYDHEIILKSLKIDNEYYKRKYNNLNRKKVLLIFAEILVGGCSTKSSSALAILNASSGIVKSSSAALLTNIAILITNVYKLKLKLRYTKLGDWFIVITLLYEQTLEESMIDKKIH